MKKQWRWITCRQPHECCICHEQIMPRQQCWMRSVYEAFIGRWLNSFTCTRCEWAVPRSQRVEPEAGLQLQLL